MHFHIFQPFRKMFMFSYEFSWFRTNSHVSPRILTICHVFISFQRFLTFSHVFPHFYEFPTNSHDSTRLPTISHDSPRFPTIPHVFREITPTHLNCHVSPRILTHPHDFPRFPWILTIPPRFFTNHYNLQRFVTFPTFLTVPGET